VVPGAGLPSAHIAHNSFSLDNSLITFCSAFTTEVINHSIRRGSARTWHSGIQTMEAILLRQALQPAAASSTTAAMAAATTYVAPPGYALVECATGNNFDGRIGLRISAIFVILVGSLLGEWIRPRRH
jgi:hypothetical protein